MARRGVPGFRPRVLRAAREGAGLSVSELARRTGLNHAMVLRYEDGSAAPTPENLVLVAGALDADPRDFLEEGGLATLRAARGLSQQGVVAALRTPDLTVGAYQALESGRVRRLRHSDAVELAKVFQVSVETVVKAHEWDLAQSDARRAGRSAGQG
ncbi:transcriptional regulator with XRE-family HTH domain [Spinactinospora alkalitolerans]|uniref:Transcriptional regulator with XRE-family HTH domain n=1 Tax=Spinactinospora alkalitolerans TaxID=687207 RepID=A0A852U3E2_9ACTN|nr:helix-turn-helix transcriptional regulator [Spinactinospora alkalitolerans]NYE50691.1 transcriptional regulator with XRE-family HTH domain [Spinactinospora alkalitolerans]